MDQRIFLDNNATTPLDPQVFEAMCYDLCQVPRNPSSIHSFGREARNELTKARRFIADTLKVLPEELIFTSGASESNNYLFHGFFEAIFPKKIISTELEHSTLYKNLLDYQKKGGEVVFLPVDEYGAPRAEQLEEELKKGGVALLVFMSVNNETGVKTDIKAFSKLAQLYQVPLIVDAVAQMGKEPIRLEPGITAMTFSAHKFHGPKGMGLLYLSNEYELPSLIVGGGQEGGHRAGTTNLAGALGFAKALECAEKSFPESTKRMQELRDYFESELTSRLDGVKVNGTGPRICNTSCLAFEGMDGESLLMNLDLKGVACSHGSACSSGSLAPSRVLQKMGLPIDRIHSSLRFALSRMTTREEIERAVKIIIECVKQMQSITTQEKSS